MSERTRFEVLMYCNLRYILLFCLTQLTKQDKYSLTCTKRVRSGKTDFRSSHHRTVSIPVNHFFYNIKTFKHLSSPVEIFIKIRLARLTFGLTAEISGHLLVEALCCMEESLYLSIPCLNPSKVDLLMAPLFEFVLRCKIDRLRLRSS